jgi:hypothetical protein
MALLGNAEIALVPSQLVALLLLYFNKTVRVHADSAFSYRPVHRVSMWQ